MTESKDYVRIDYAVELQRMNNNLQDQLTATQQKLDVAVGALERISNMNTTDNSLNPSILMSDKKFAKGLAQATLSTIRKG